jgi:hypothetical protein
MIAPFALTPSRLCVLAVLTAACSGGPGTTTPSHAARTQDPSSEVQVAPRHGPGTWFFRQVDALSLRDDQHVALDAIQDHLAAVRRAILRLADALELGELDATKAADEKAALSAALGEAKASFAKAINDVHDTLDGTQRVALVQRLREHDDGHAHADGSHKHGLAKLAFEIGLTEQQQARIAEELGKGLDELFPERKIRREQSEAKMKAMAGAFVTDDFDAAEFDLADHAQEAITSSVEIASRGIDVSNRVLSHGQRRLAAEWMRDKAAEL